MSKGRAALTLAALTIVGTAIPVFASPTYACNKFNNDGCIEDGGASYTGRTQTETKSLPTEGPNPSPHPARGKTTVPYEYALTRACSKNDNPEKNFGCGGYAESACVDVKNATGPLSFIFQRAVISKKNQTPWKNIGVTCWPELVPEVKAKPQITVAMLRSAFVKTPFVKPRATMEPVGNRTLVNLPNYFAADFSGAGYGPEEIRTFTVLGQEVQIKPVLKSNTFHFGDGSSLGPTESRGGGYPDGDIKHTYLGRGTVQASVTTVYGGQFAVDGGEFTDLPGTATITGPVQPIQVLEATARLVR